MSRKTFGYKDVFIKTMMIQDLPWKLMDNGCEFEFEILSPLKAQCHHHKKGAYVRFLVQATADTDNPPIFNGSFLWFEMPLQTWNQAMYGLPIQLKREWNTLGEDNIWIKAVKRNKSYIQISKTERRTPTVEHRQKCEQYYGEEQ